MKLLLMVLWSLICALIYSCEGRGVLKSRQEAAEKNLIESRVIGGTEVLAGSLPYQVSIQNTFGEHVCGGAIIDHEWVLTAAHCAEWPKQYLKVVTGTVNWTNPDASYTVKDMKVHCAHNKPMYHNDIALVQLNTPIVYNQHTQPIKLASNNTLKEGDQLLLSGWGSTKVWGRYPQILRKVHLTYMDHDKCSKSIINPNWLGEGHICTDTFLGKGSCQGDSGGPLVDLDNFLVGIVNWGEPCAIGRPDVFASVAYYHNWIRSVMDGGKAC